MTTLFSLDGRKALVTGASRGLGRAIAEGFARAGAELVLAARDAEGLERTAVDIRGIAARPVSTIAFDLADLAGVERALETLGGEKASIDILVNNGGIAGWSPLHESTIEDWHRTFDVNVGSMYLLCR
jgi:gluconate 5-dehydrogenase